MGLTWVTAFQVEARYGVRVNAKRTRRPRLLGKRPSYGAEVMLVFGTGIANLVQVRWRGRSMRASMFCQEDIEARLAEKAEERLATRGEPHPESLFIGNMSKVSTATGSALDKIASTFAYTRMPGETDAALRARVNATLSFNRRRSP